MWSARKTPHTPFTAPLFFRGAVIAPPDGMVGLAQGSPCPHLPQDAGNSTRLCNQGPALADPLAPLGCGKIGRKAGEERENGGGVEGARLWSAGSCSGELGGVKTRERFRGVQHLPCAARGWRCAGRSLGGRVTVGQAKEHNRTHRNKPTSPHTHSQKQAHTRTQHPHTHTQTFANA